MAERIVRYRWLVAVMWLIVAGFAAGPASRVEQLLEVGARIRPSESAAVDSLIATRFRAPFRRYAVLVVTGALLPLEPAGAALADTLVSLVASVPGISAVRGWRGSEDTLFLAPATGAFFIVAGLDDTREPADRLVSRLRAATAAFPREHPGMALRWTGQDALNADIRLVSASEARSAEWRVLPLTLALLIVTFGSLVAAGLPVAIGALTIVITLGAAGSLAVHWPLSIMLQSFATMVGLGLGIDYALLTVSRFREAGARGQPPPDAAIAAIRQAGRTIFLSAGTVAIGFGALAVVPITEIRSLAVGGLLATAAAALLSTTLLPVALCWLGARVEWGTLRSQRGTGKGWRLWGGYVIRHRWVVLLLATLPVVVLAAQARRLRAGEPRTDWLPATAESVVALHELQRGGRGALLQRIEVVLELPGGTELLKPAGWELVHRVHELLARDPRIATMFGALDFGSPVPTSRLIYFGIADSVRAQWVSSERRAVLLQAVPREGLSPGDLVDFVREMRPRAVALEREVPGVRVRFGGLPAMRADYQDSVAGRLSEVVALVLGATAIALFLAFRSLLVPLKALALNLLAVAAGLGAVVLLFQEGSSALLGHTAPLGAVFPAVPVLVFATAFGMSMDYEIFLLARIAELRASGLGEDDAIVEGLARTGPLITNAAAIMVVVFGAFGLGSFLFMQILGVALAVSILLDAVVIRGAIGPALLAVAGRWNWWPGSARGRCSEADPLVDGPTAHGRP